MTIRFLNRFAAAVVVAGGAFILSGVAANLMFPDSRPGKPAFPLPSDTAPSATKAPDVPVRAAHADRAHGEQLADALCSACHTLERGGASMVGPALWGVAGTHVADVPGYTFSAALTAHRNEVFDDQTLSTWLKSPSDYAPGTRMGFGGIDSDSDRADLIAFLDTLKDAPAAPASPVPPSPSPLAAEHVVAGDAAAGKATAQQMCAMCHSFDKDGPVMMGPPLYGVVGRAPASVAGFAYSDGIKTIGGVWSADRLDHWITDPRAMVAETRMAFPGVPSAADRANIVAFLATLHDRAAP